MHAKLAAVFNWLTPSGKRGSLNSAWPVIFCLAAKNPGL